MSGTEDPYAVPPGTPVVKLYRSLLAGRSASAPNTWNSPIAT